MLEHVHRDRPIEGVVFKGQRRLAIAGDRRHVRKALAQSGYELRPELDTRVLLAGQVLVLEMLAQPGTDLECANPAGHLARERTERVMVVEAFDDRVLAGQHLVPVAHEVVTYGLLLGREGRERLRPGPTHHR